jgi:putative hemolysin
MLGTQIAILAALLILSALFSGVETAMVSINQIKAKALVKQRKKGAAVLYRLKQKPHKLIITLLIGNNLANIGAASLAAVIFTDMFGSSGIGIATGIMTFLVLIFGEITPKTFASQNAEKVSLFAARPVEILSIIFAPFVWIFDKITQIMLKVVGSKGEAGLSETELETIVTMGRKEGILEKEAAEIMHNVLKFGGTTAREIMTPRIDMIIIDGNKKLNEVLDLIVKTPYSRYPVSVEHNKIEGILDIDDVLKQVRDKKLTRKVKSILRPILFVPESKEIDDLLTEFEGKEVPMAIVVDEYGDIEGLVTVEDILEEIVGDIFDKSKAKNIFFNKIEENIIKVDAKTPIDELNKALKLGIKTGQFNTIAGYVQDRLQRIPHQGEKIKLRNATIEIVKTTKQGIKTLRIIKH